MSSPAQNFNSKHVVRRKTHRIDWNKIQQSGMFRPTILLLIAAILITIAILQYHWVNQLRSEMNQRVKNTLQLLITEWNFKLYEDVSAICVALQVGPDSGAHDVWDDYVQRYASWRNREPGQNEPEGVRPSRELVQDVYVWETSRKAPSLFLLNPSTRRIQAAETPEHLSQLLARLQERSTNLPTALQAWGLNTHDRIVGEDVPRPRGSPTHNDPLSGWQLDLTVPAIVHPLVPHRAARDASREQEEEQSVDWIVVVLRSEVIDKVILPALAQRYFGGQQGLDYKVAVVSQGDQSRVLYSSDKGFPNRDSGVYDGIMDVYQPGSLKNNLQDPRLDNAGLPREGKSSVTGPTWFRIIQYTPRAASWTLVVQRRGTSWGDVVREVWVTNLATGLAFLTLLAVNVGLVVLATRRLQRLAAQQMNFVASVSHELRTPLTIITSAAENISDGVLDNPADIREHGAMITGQSRLLLDMVDRILLFASSTAGKNLQLLRPVAIAEIFDKVEHNVAALMQSSSMQLETSLSSNLPLALADPDWLSLCLRNLIANAVKYRGKSHWVGLAAELRKGQDGVPEICIDVKDRGVGIRETEVSKVFDPFYRSSDAAQSKVKGTGLGLAFAKHIVTEMGGTLSVESKFGAGSTFTLHLPVANEASSETTELVTRKGQEQSADGSV